MMIWSFGQFTKWPIEAFVILKGHSLSHILEFQSSKSQSFVDKRLSICVMCELPCHSGGASRGLRKLDGQTGFGKNCKTPFF